MPLPKPKSRPEPQERREYVVRRDGAKMIGPYSVKDGRVYLTAAEAKFYVEQGAIALSQ